MGPRLEGFPFVLILSSVCIICFSFVVSNLTVVSFVCMAHRTRRGTNNSAAAMLDSNQPSSSADPPSSAASPPINSNPVTTPPSVILPPQDLSRAFFSSLGGYVTSYFGGFTKSLIEFFGGGIRGIGHNVVGHNVIRFCCY